MVSERGPEGTGERRIRAPKGGGCNRARRWKDNSPKQKHARREREETWEVQRFGVLLSARRLGEKIMALLSSPFLLVTLRRVFSRAFPSPPANLNTAALTQLGRSREGCLFESEFFFLSLHSFLLPFSCFSPLSSHHLPGFLNDDRRIARVRMKDVSYDTVISPLTIRRLLTALLFPGKSEM